MFRVMVRNLHMHVHVHVYPHGRYAKNSTHEDELHVVRCLSSPPKHDGGVWGGLPPQRKGRSPFQHYPPNFGHTHISVLSCADVPSSAQMCIYMGPMHSCTSCGSCDIHSSPYHVYNACQSSWWCAYIHDTSRETCIFTHISCSDVHVQLHTCTCM